MKYIINDPTYKDGSRYPSFYINTKFDQIPLAATNWVIHASSKKDALENCLISLELLLPDEYEVSTHELDEDNFTIIPESITEHDVDVWVNSSPQKERYGNLNPDVISNLHGFALRAAEMVEADEFPYHSGRDGVAIKCKVSGYIYGNTMKRALVESLSEIEVDLPLVMTDQEIRIFIDAMIEYADGKYWIDDMALEHGREDAHVIADDIGVTIKGYEGRSGGYMMLDLPTNGSEWEFNEIMQYAIMAWEVDSYVNKSGYEYDYALSLAHAFEDEKECRDVITKIMSARIGHDLSGLTIC